MLRQRREIKTLTEERDSCRKYRLKLQERIEYLEGLIPLKKAADRIEKLKGALGHAVLRDHPPSDGCSGCEAIKREL